MLGGYTGKVLYINLTDGNISKENLKEKLAMEFLGGRGLGAKILFDDLKPGVDPLGPDNELIFVPGPLTGTGIPLCARFAVVTKSPLTGMELCSFCGGGFGPELKFAGYDALVVQGKAEKPVYLWIRDEDVEIKEAGTIWGVSTEEAQEAIKKKVNEPKAEVASIGIAGENLVKYACILAGKRAAGRGGAGAVMGSKNLKAIAVKGTGKVTPSDAKETKEATRALIKQMKGQPHTEGISASGSALLLGIANTLGALPTKNFQDGRFDDYTCIDVFAMKEFQVKSVGCPNCPVGCSKIRSVTKGPYAGNTSEGPDYQTIAAFGSNCGNSSPEAIITADMLCDKFGIDTISTAVTIGFAMELYERGILTKRDIDGLELNFGNHEAMIVMISKIAKREGIGDILANGVRIAAEKIGRGAENYAMHVKGLEVPMWDPRGFKAWGVNYATSNRGACHNRGTPQQEFGGYPGYRFEIKGKGSLTKRNQDLNAVVDSMIICWFIFPNIPSEYFVACLKAVTGNEEFGRMENLLRIGERIYNIERAFNIREGITRKDDTLPRRFLEEPMPTGPAEGQKVDLGPMLDEYYMSRGWDKETGLPKRERLEMLGLSAVADELERLGKLAATE